MESQLLLRRAVAAGIEAQEHPATDERDEAIAEVGLVLQEVVRQQLADAWEFDSRYATLDGLRTLSVTTDGRCQLHILGAFYLLEGRGHRMLPVDAAFNVKPGTESMVRVAGRGSVFEMPTSERQFVRGVEGAEWAHTVGLRLG